MREEHPTSGLLHETGDRDHSSVDPSSSKRAEQLQAQISSIDGGMVEQGTEADDEESHSSQSLQHGAAERHWLDSPFAVGPTKSSWADENVGFKSLCHAIFSRSKHTHILCTAFVCGWTRAGRVGNMVVLWQRSEETVPTSSGDAKRPRLLCVLGPYWMVCTFVTLPFILAFSLVVFAWRLAPRPCLPIVISWSILHFLWLVTLLRASCADPGILNRHGARPTIEEGESWSWNSQAKTFRPSTARYDPECAVVIEEYRHTCPWIGTALGRRNHRWLKAFVVLTVAVLAYDVSLLLFHKVRPYIPVHY